MEVLISFVPRDPQDQWDTTRDVMSQIMPYCLGQQLPTDPQQVIASLT